MSILDHVWGKSVAADRVWARVVGMAAAETGTRLLMIFQAYIDDSSQDNEAFVLAGHVASVATWAEFSKEWEQLLDFCRPTADGVRRFKMQEFNIASREDMWRVRAFYKLLEKYEIVSIATGLLKSDLVSAQNQVFVPNFTMTVDWESNWGLLNNVFIILFRILMDSFNSLRSDFYPELQLDAPVDFIFDEQTEKKFVSEGWGMYKASRGASLQELYGAKPRFEDEERFMPLQAADLWAFWVREQLRPFPRHSSASKEAAVSFLDEISKTKRKQFKHFMSRDSIVQMLMFFSRVGWEERNRYNITYHYV